MSGLCGDFTSSIRTIEFDEGSEKAVHNIRLNHMSASYWEALVKLILHRLYARKRGFNFPKEGMEKLDITISILVYKIQAFIVLF